MSHTDEVYSRASDVALTIVYGVFGRKRMAPFLNSVKR